MSAQQWVVNADAEGIRLDKFLAEPERLGSRGRAADALQRGKVFLNDARCRPGTVAGACRPATRCGFWIDRPGSAHRRTTRAARAGELDVLYEDDVLIAVSKPPGLLTVPLPRKRDRASVQELLDEHLLSPRSPQSAGCAPDRPRYVRGRRLRHARATPRRG